MTIATAAADRGGSCPGAWRAVSMLSILYAFSAIDRLILSLFVIPIRAELKVSDIQIGILFGLSFAVLYTLAGLPIAKIIDHGDRVRLITIGVIVWSGSTVLSAFSQDFTSLLICRAGVAVGEAVLTPGAVSLIADLFSGDRRGKATSIFVSAGTVTGLGATAIGGGVLAVATMLSPSVGMTPWRLTLILIGAVGILAAILFAFLVREPRRGDAALTDYKGGSLHFSQHWLFYSLLFGGVGLSVVISYALIGWAPTLIVRRFNIAPSTAGYVFGVTGVIAGLAGILAVPRVARWATRGEGQDGLLLAGVALTLAATPAVVAAMLTRNLWVFIAALAVALLALPAITLLPSLFVQQVTPPRQRGQMMALYILIANLLGLGCGPTLAGALADTVFRNNGGMAMALVAIGGITLPLAAILFVLARAPYKRLVAANF